MKAWALALVWTTAAAATLTTPPFPLIEASGSNAGGDHVAIGQFCGGNETFAVTVNGTSGAVAVLRGPTPHVVARGADPALVGATAVLAADVAPGFGDDLVIATSRNEVIVISFLSSVTACTGQLLVRSKAANVGVVAGLAPLPASASRSNVGVFAAVATGIEKAKQWGVELRWQGGSSGSLALVSRTTLGLPPSASDGCTWSGAASVVDRTDAVGSPSGAAPLLLVSCSEPGSEHEQHRSFPVRIFAFALGGNGGLAHPSLLATRTVTLSNPLLAVEVSDFYGDGAPLGLVVTVNANAELLWLTDGGTPLLSAGSFCFEPNVTAGRRWRSVATGSLLPLRSGGGGGGGGLDGAHTLASERQLLALRHPVGAGTAAKFEVGMLLYGRPGHWLRRAASFANVRGTQEFKISYNDSAASTGNLTFPLNTSELTDILKSTHANTYGFYVCDCAPAANAGVCPKVYSYLSFVQFLEASKASVVDGNQMRVWLGLLPPTEALKPAPNGSASGNGCQVPPDSPLTDFNETEIFGGSGGGGGHYTDYSSWGTLVGLLSKQYPHLTAVDIDDFSANVQAGNGAFTGDSVAKMLSNIRRESPQVALASVMYDNFESFPDLALMLDSPVYFFRNAAEGTGSCAADSCVWGPENKGGPGDKEGFCLAGVCSEPTTYNVAGEIARVSAGMPPGRRVLVGYYATQHSTLGQPTPRYVSRLLQTIATQPNVGGVVTYTLKDARAGCKASRAPLYGTDQNPAPPTSPLTNSTAWAQHQLGCVVRDQYSAIAGATKT